MPMGIVQATLYLLTSCSDSLARPDATVAAPALLQPHVGSAVCGSARIGWPLILDWYSQDWKCWQLVTRRDLSAAGSAVVMWKLPAVPRRAVAAMHTRD